MSETYRITVVYQRNLSQDAPFIPCLKGPEENPSDAALTRAVEKADPKTLAKELVAQLMTELQEACDSEGLPDANWKATHISVNGHDFDASDLED